MRGARRCEEQAFFAHNQIPRQSTPSLLRCGNQNTEGSQERTNYNATRADAHTRTQTHKHTQTHTHTHTHTHTRAQKKNK